jgi:hypothetical protein
MSKIFNEQAHMELIAEAAVLYQLAETKRNSFRRELNDMYTVFFQAHGRPYGDDRRRIDPDDDAYLPVLDFTNAAYGRWKAQRDLTTKLKRKLRTLVERLGRAQ